MTAEPRGPVPLFLVPPAPAAPEISDPELVRAVVAREPWAATSLWNRYSALVYRLVHRTLGSEEEARDVTQEVFLRLFSSIHTLRDATLLRSFIVSIVMRILKWELRRRRVRRWVTLSDNGELPEAPVGAPDASARRALRRFCGILDTLGARDRIVFVLRHVEGLTLEEVAQTAQMSTATVKRRLSKASEKISRLVDRDAELAAFLGGRTSQGEQADREDQPDHES